MEINKVSSKFRWIYTIGFFIILALPILTWSPWFYPADFGKSIVFRSITAVLLFLFIFQILYRKNQFPLFNIKSNKIFWALAALFIVFLLSSFFAVDPYFSFWGSPYRGGGFVTFAFYFVFSLLTFFVLKDSDWKKAWLVATSAGIVVCAVALMQFYGLFDKFFISVESRPSSTIGNPILLGIYLLLLLFPTLSFLLAEKNIKLKIFYSCSLLIFVYTILISESRAAYFGFAFGILLFLLLFPKKIRLVKIASFLIIFLFILVIIYANLNPRPAEIISQNRIANSLYQRLSIKNALNDERFKAWQIIVRQIADKPILGWGPENFAVGFDKYYDPKIVSSSWWDRAHNVFLDIGTQTGILGIAAYLALFTALFWHVRKTKHQTENASTQIILTGIQATLAGYLIANFFSLDSFPIYLIFFFIIAYILYLSGASNNQPPSEKINRKMKWESPTIIAILIVVIAFLWQYNLVPFYINAQINKADALSQAKYCNKALEKMDENLKSHSFLDSYARLQYVQITKTCNNFYPENNLAYVRKGFEILQEAVKIQPLYTRYWISLGEFATVLASQDQNIDAKNNLLEQAGNHLDKAQQLAPKHQEVFIAKARMEITGGDYQRAKIESEKCIELSSDLGECYFYLALSKIYLKDVSGAKEDLKTAGDKKYNIESQSSLGQLGDAYASIPDYKNLSEVFEKLIVMNPSNTQYHSSLAFFYKQLGQYAKAREEAMRVLELSPESKQNVEEFLRTLSQ